MKSIGQSARMASIGHLLNRRRSILAIGSALVVYGLPARAQPGPMRRVGFLSGGTQSDAANFFKSFLDGLRELGYREGQNLTLDARFADYSAEQAIKLAAEIAALKPAVIVASGSGVSPVSAHSSGLPPQR